MKRLTVTADRYRRTHTTTGTIDAPTILYLSGKVIAQEYGRQGTIAIVPRKYVRGTLIMTAGSTLWAQEIWLHREGLIAAINRRCGTEAVRKITVSAE